MWGGLYYVGTDSLHTHMLSGCEYVLCVSIKGRCVGVLCVCVCILTHFTHRCCVGVCVYTCVSIYVCVYICVCPYWCVSILGCYVEIYSLNSHASVVLGVYCVSLLCVYTLTSHT